MNTNANTLTKHQRSTILNEHIYYEVVHALGVFQFEPKNYFAWELVNHSRMAHARILIKFFDPPKTKSDGKRDDDVDCTHFGFSAGNMEIPEDDRLRWGKDLFHLSTLRLRFESTPESKVWPKIFLRKVHERSVAFIRHILHDEQPVLFDVERRKWATLLGELESGREMFLDIRVNASGGLMSYTFSRGRGLPDGLSEFTPLLNTDPGQFPGAPIILQK